MKTAVKLTIAAICIIAYVAFSSVVSMNQVKKVTNALVVNNDK